ncbi:MAG: FG-GAP-like repeat-containing protein, partial [Limisphaerales bacterium]
GAANEADPENDPICFRVEAVSSGTLTINGSPIVAGSTLICAGDEVVWTPTADANGVLNAFTVVGWDGQAASAAPVQVSVNVAAVNDPPTLTNVNVLPGTEDTPLAITYATLAGAANEADPDGDAICFRVEAVTSGTLTINGSPVLPGTTLICAGDEVVWTPDVGVTGPQPAFTVVAWDGAADSGLPVQVTVNVAAGAHATNLEFVDQPVLEVAGQYFVIQPVIQTLDVNGNFTTNISNLLPGNSLVTLSLIGGPGTLAGTLTLDLNNATPGVITWTNLAASMAGTNWQLVASNSVLGSITSTVFVVVSPVVTPPPFGTNGLPHILMTDSAGPIGLWLSNLRGDKYSWYKPSIGVLWRDLVVANYKSNSISVRLCKDDGSFENPVVYPTGLNPFAVRSGFFSNHTFEDVAVANYGTNTISVFRTVRNGTGQLSPRVDYVIGTTPNPGPISLAAGNASGGAYQDIFVANANENTVSVLRNVNGGFVLSTNIPVGLNPLSVSLADMDGDGLLDIVASNHGDGTLTVLRGRPDFRFELWQTITLFPGGQPAPTHLQVSDLNQDGRMDIVVANGGSNTVSVLLQTSAQEFPVFTNYNVGLNPRTILLRDLNRDGISDIAVANYDGASVDVMLGNGDGTFERGGRIPVGRNPMCIVGSNFNGDRATDIAVSNFGDDTISFFLYSGPLSKDMEITTLRNEPVSLKLIGEILDGKDLGYVIERMPANGTLSGTPPNLIYTPAPGFSGLDSFTYRAYDTNYFGPERFQFPEITGSFNTNVPSPAATVRIFVRGVNQAPSFALSSNRVVVASSTSLQTIENLAMSISAGPNEPHQTVNFFINVTNRAFFSVVPTMTTNGHLVFRPAHNSVGTNYISIRLRDDGGTLWGGVAESAPQEVAIVVLPNMAPSFNLSTSAVAAPAFGPVQSLPGFATQITAGPNEDGQRVNFVVTTTNSAFFMVQPTISTNGTLTFAPSWAAEGTTYVSVRLRDNGPIALGGVNESAEQIFAVTMIGQAIPAFAGGKAASYNGLFCDTNGVAKQSAGYASIKVTPRLTYSLKLLVDGNAVAVSGKFNTDGTATVTTKNRSSKFDKPELTLNLAIDFANDGDRLTGTISEGTNWIADLTADRMVWVSDVNEATDYTNNYTMILPGFADKAKGPAGSGHAVVTLDKRGKVKVAGAMGDGQPVKQATFVSQDGYLPVFSPGYRVSRTNSAQRLVVEANGFLMGWLHLKTNDLGNLAPKGSVHWINTGWTNTTYADGFTNLNIQVQSSRWVAPERGASQAAVNMSAALIQFADGDLGADAFSARFLVTTNTTLALDKTLSYPNSVRAGLA